MNRPVSLHHWMQDLWDEIHEPRRRRSQYLEHVIMRKGEWENRNPRDPLARGAGYYAFEVGVSGITVEEYAETLQELWRLRRDLNQKESGFYLGKHLKWDLNRGYVRLVKYPSPGVEEARRKNGLPSLAEPAPQGYRLVNRGIIDRVLGGAARKL